MTSVSGMRPPVVAVFNHKGGVAKTTTSCNLAVCLAAHGYRVVLVDLDAQGNATGSFGILPLPPVGAYDVLTGKASLDETLLPTQYPGVTLLPATVQLRTAELELAGHERFHTHLRDRLAEHGLDRFADIAVIDCSPSMGAMTANALSAAAAVLIPARPDPFTHEGLVNTWHEVRRLREQANSSLSVAGILLTMTDDDQSAADVARTMRAEFGDHVYEMVIPADSKVTEAAQLAVPVTVLDPDGHAGLGYVEATRELIHRLRRRGVDLAEPTDLYGALNTLREWRGGQLALRRIPRQGKGWTVVPEANQGAEPAKLQAPRPSPVPPKPPLDITWPAIAFVAGVAVGIGAMLLR